MIFPALRTVPLREKAFIAVAPLQLHLEIGLELPGFRWLSQGYQRLCYRQCHSGCTLRRAQDSSRHCTWREGIRELYRYRGQHSCAVARSRARCDSLQVCYSCHWHGRVACIWPCVARGYDHCAQLQRHGTAAQKSERGQANANHKLTKQRRCPVRYRCVLTDSRRLMRMCQCWVVLQPFQGCQPQIRAEYSEFFTNVTHKHYVPWPHQLHS